MRVAGLVLAAGAGRRFGGPKALVQLRGERLVDRAVRTARGGGCTDVIVVSGAAPLEVAAAAVVHNPGWAQGIGSSLQTGLQAVGAYDAVVVLLVDQPGISPAAVQRVVGAADSPAALVVATYAGEWGHPVLLGGEHVEAVAAGAAGDVGARPYLRARQAAVVNVECADIADPTDVDTPQDLTHFS